MKNDKPQHTQTRTHDNLNRDFNNSNLLGVKLKGVEMIIVYILALFFLISFFFGFFAYGYPSKKRVKHFLDGMTDYDLNSFDNKIIVKYNKPSGAVCRVGIGFSKYYITYIDPDVTFLVWRFSAEEKRIDKLYKELNNKHTNLRTTD